MKHTPYLRVRRREEATDQQSRLFSVLAEQSSKVLVFNNRETLLTAFASTAMLHHTRLVPDLPVYTKISISHRCHPWSPAQSLVLPVCSVNGQMVTPTHL